MAHSAYKLLSLLAPALLLTALCLYLSRNDAVACRSTFNIINNGREHRLHFTFMAEKGSGEITIAGADSPTAEASTIKKRFSYSEIEPDLFLLKSAQDQATETSAGRILRADDILPVFFTGNAKNARLPLRIVKMEESGWLFMSGNMPYFLCEKADTR